MKNQLFILGHRGFCSRYPENTLVSFGAAAELGVDGVELDVRQAVSGELVVMHDESVDRTTDGKGLVRGLGWDYLSKLDAGGWKSKEFSGERIPLLSEVYKLLKGRCMIYCEMEDHIDVQELIKLIYRMDMQDQVALSSFYIDNINAARKLAPGIPTALISAEKLDDNTGHVKKAIELGVRVLDLWECLLDERTAAYAHSHGVPICGWVVNDCQTAVRMIGMGINRITTDNPDILLDFRKQIYNY